MKQLTPRSRAVCLMLACAGLWSIAGILIKVIPWNPLVIAGVRSLIASGIVAGYLWISKTPLRVNRSSVLSGVMLCATFLLFVTANKLTTSANAIVLQFTAPVFIVLISAVFYRQRFRRLDMAVVAATLSGIALCFLDRLSGGSLLGDCLAVLSGLCMAFMFVFTGRADEASRMSGILLGQLFTALAGLPAVLAFPTPLSRQAVASVVALGVLQLGIPYVLYGLAVRDCPPLGCSLIGAVEPLLNPLWVFLLDGEAPGGFALTGGAVVVATVTAWCVLGARAQEAAEDSPGRNS